MKQVDFFDVVEQLARLDGFVINSKLFPGLWILKCSALTRKGLWPMWMGERRTVAV